VLGGRLMGADMAADILQAWLETAFAGGRHARRVEKIADVEVRHAGDRAPGP
jgi:ribose 5-phosphate isomerase B